MWYRKQNVLSILVFFNRKFTIDSFGADGKNHEENGLSYKIYDFKIMLESDNFPRLITVN